MTRRPKALPAWVLDGVRETADELMRDGVTPAEALGVITMAVAHVAGELAVAAYFPKLKR